jgi:hypothetical protein
MRKLCFATQGVSRRRVAGSHTVLREVIKLNAAELVRGVSVLNHIFVEGPVAGKFDLATRSKEMT